MVTTLCALSLAIGAFAQGGFTPILNNTPGGASGLSDVQNFGQWQMFSTNAVTAGAGSLTTYPCYFNIPGATGTQQNWYPLAPGVQVKVLDPSGSNSETVTITGVSTPAAAFGSSFPGGYSCGFSATFANAHAAGVKLVSGDFGLGEAGAFFGASQGFVVTTPNWGGNVATILGVGAAAPQYFGGRPIAVLDISQGFPEFYELRPAATTLISAAAAPTNQQVSGGALTASGTYLTACEYVDYIGGTSLASTDSASTVLTGSNQTIVETGCPATTGAAGWIPMITASGGGSGTEIEVPVTGAVCNISTQYTLKPICAIGATATIAANPSSTGKEQIISSAHTTFALQPSQTVPAPFQTQFASLPAQPTLNSSNEDLGAIYVPAVGGQGYFNVFGKSWRVCAKIATGTQVASSVLKVNLNMAPNYGQSAVTVATVTFATQTQGAAGTVHGCFVIETTTTGASGTFMADTPAPWTNTLNTTPSQTVAATVDVSTGNSSAINLTGGVWLSLNLQDTTANNVTAPQLLEWTIEPTVNN